MRIAPTLQGGLRIDIESLLDWASLEFIAIDAAKLEGSLPQSLGSKMKMDDDWKELILPDLQQSFDHQVQSVNREIKLARSENAEQGEIHITSENLEPWYGALNQARIALENEHQISQYNDIKELEEVLEDDIQVAFIKYHFYTVLQEHLLEHVKSA